MSKKIAQLQSLFYLLEKHLYAPAAFVQITDAARRPGHIVRDKCHQFFYAVDFNIGHD
jgi:hypothetical protein